MYSEKTAAEYYKVKKLIQNVMDSTRYLSPELQIFSSFIIPIQESHSVIIENPEIMMSNCEIAIPNNKKWPGKVATEKDAFIGNARKC